MNILLFFLAITLPCSILAQSGEVEIKAPEFPGGEVELQKYLSSIAYPAKAFKKSLQGAVAVKFVIDTNGQVFNVKISESSGSAVLDSAAVIHVQHMPTWKPAYQDDKPYIIGKKVRILFGLDILPQYPGGDQKLAEYLSGAAYPEGVEKDELQGKSFIRFVVEANGEVTHAEIDKTIGSALLDSAALIHVRNMLRWEPGNQLGKAVRVLMIVPVMFDPEKPASIVIDGDTIYNIVEVQPEFPGGVIPLMRYLSSIKYPEEARERDIQGDVYSKFIVDKTGKVTKVTIAKSSGSSILDDATLAHLTNMPDWKPGYQSGKPVNVYLTVPVKFTLQ